VVANELHQNTESRSGDHLNLQLKNNRLIAGESVQVPFVVSSDQSIRGFQFTLEYDTQLLSFESFRSDLLEIGDENYAVYEEEEKVTVSWNADITKNINEGDILLEAIFSAKSNSDHIGLMDINSEITKSEAYNGDFDIIGIILELESKEHDISKGVELYHNSPNPFSGTTAISFWVPKSASVTLRVYDISGQEIYQIVDYYHGGYNTIVLDGNKVEQSGMLYYQIEVGNEVRTSKMIKLD